MMDGVGHQDRSWEYSLKIITRNILISKNTIIASDNTLFSLHGAV